MTAIDRQTLQAESDRFDALVSQTPDIDQFCSSTLWVLPSFHAFLPDHRLWCHRFDEGYIALAVDEEPGLGTYIHPLEASWALASPFITDRPQALAQRFVELLESTDLPWEVLFLSGLSPTSQLFRALLHKLRGRYSLGIGPTSRRCAADLQGGLDGYLGRRSSSFRANLRRLRRRRGDAGITTDYIDDASPTDSQALFERALSVESHSWKADADTGILDGPMRAFYNDMLPRLARRRALRFLFLRLDNQDIAYCFGGILGNTFRGLQMSYHNDFRHHSPGNLAQIEMIARLVDEGITTYDLGSHMDYKTQWAEGGLETVALIVRRALPG